MPHSAFTRHNINSRHDSGEAMQASPQKERPGRDCQALIEASPFAVSQMQDAVIDHGPMPLTVLRQSVDEWIASERTHGAG